MFIVHPLFVCYYAVFVFCGTSHRTTHKGRPQSNDHPSKRHCLWTSRRRPTTLFFHFGQSAAVLCLRWTSGSSMSAGRAGTNHYRPSIRCDSIPANSVPQSEKGGEHTGKAVCWLPDIVTSGAAECQQTKEKISLTVSDLEGISPPTTHFVICCPRAHHTQLLAKSG